MRLLHILSVISHLSFVTTQYCDSSDAYGCNANSIDDVQASCGCILENYPGGFPASTDCISDWCCTGCADPDNCCGSENPLSCFQSSSKHSDFAQCTYIADRISACSSATTGFAMLFSTDQASCYCYNESGTYDGYSWDNAATACYTAIESQTMLPTSELDYYFDYYVGACKDSAGTIKLDKSGTSSGGVSATATPAGSTSLSGPTAGTGTSSSSSGTIAGTPPPTTTTTAPSAPPGMPSASSKSSGAAKKGLEGCGLMIPGASFLVICYIFASSLL